MANQPELKLQQQCYRWFHNTYPHLRRLMWYVENEGKRSKYQQGIVKSTGLTAGVADLHFISDSIYYAIELKTPTGKLRASQKKWGAAIVSQGGQYHVVRSLDEFKKLIKWILKS
jgi:hypothetical protein